MLSDENEGALSVCTNCGIPHKLKACKRNLVEEVQLLDANPQYTNILYSDGRETSVSLSDLSPSPQGKNSSEIDSRLPILEEDPRKSPVQ